MTDALRLEPTPAAAAEARRFVADRCSLDPIRQAEVALLTTELVSMAVRAGSEMSIVVDRSDARLMVSVQSASTFRNGLDDPLTRIMFERFARNHGLDVDVAWFEIRRPGAGMALESMPAEELLGRAAEDAEARSEVVRRYGRLATHLARRYRGKGIAFEDLEQVALFALLKALSRYEPDRGAFEAFASATISGELKRQLRDRAWSLRVPRSLQELALEVNHETARLSQRFGRTPTVAELAAEIGSSVDDILEARAANGVYWTRSLDMPTGEDDESTLRDMIGDPNVVVEDLGAWGAIAQALDQLPDRERRIVRMRFFEDMTQSEIADAVGVSQMHVSRLLARSLDQLRDLTGAR